MNLANRKPKKELKARRHERIKKPFFAVAFTDDGVQSHAIGVDISAGGTCILAQKELEPPEFSIRMTLDNDRAISVRVRSAWHDLGKLNNKVVHRYGVQYLNISDDDRDGLIEFLEGKTKSKAREQLDTIQAQPDDAHRLLPKAVRDEILQALVKLKRLGPLDPNTEPLVQYQYLGERDYSGVKKHRLLIYSRVIIGHDKVEHRSRVLIESETGKFAFVLRF